MDSTLARLPRLMAARNVSGAHTLRNRHGVLAHGRLRNAENGETVAEPSTPGSFFVVVSGRLELLRLSDTNEEVVAVL